MTEFKRTPLSLFAKCGMVLFGDIYVHQLAKRLQVSDRSVQRWSSGARDVPPEVWEEVVTMLRAEQRQFKETADEVAQLLAEVPT